MSSIQLDQIVFPIDHINAKLSVQGIYAIPQQWKNTDQANPGLFNYIVRMSKFQTSKGKICARQLTQRQKRQLQQKNKKGGKKDSKNPEPNEQQQKLKKLQQQRQKQRQQLFAKLSEQQQFYHTSEDIYRSPFLKFEEKGSSAEFTGNDCLIFEQRIMKDKGDWIYIYKVPTVSQDQLAKMRKSKPKTINNINDLNPLVMRAWVSFQSLSLSNSQKQLKDIRCKIQQVDKTAQTSQPNLEKTYIKISFSLQQSIIKQKDLFSTSSLINDPLKSPQVSLQIKSIQQLKQEICLAVQSLAMEYSTMFWKQINMQEQQRNGLIFLGNKKGETTKRKQQFLYDFNVTGKYKILKDRIKKCIVHLCETKYKNIFVGMKSFNGIKCNNLDQIYSQIYNLLITSYQDTLYKIICQKQQSLGEVLVLNNNTLKQSKEIILNSYKQETIIQRAKRTIKQYQLILNFQYGQKVLHQYILDYPELTQLKYQYGIYCLKYNLKSSKEILPYIEEYLTKQKYTLTQDKKIQFMIILLNNGGQNNSKGWIILRQLIQNEISANRGNPSLSLCRFLLLASVVLNSMGKPNLAIKYRSFALREYQKLSLNQSQQIQQNNHKTKPIKTQIPSITGKAQYTEIGTTAELIKLYKELITYLNAFSSFDLIQRVIVQKSKNESKTQRNQENQINFQEKLPQLNRLLISNNQNSVNKLLEITQKLNQNSKSPEQKKEILQFTLKAYILKINSSKVKQTKLLSELQTCLKKNLMTNNDPVSRFFTLLRLGYLYCNKQQYGNARACILKYLEKASQYPEYLSGLSYKLLGISCLKLRRVSDAVQNFIHWHLCDSKNKQAWLYLSLAFAYQDKPIVVNQCLNQYNKRAQSNNLQVEQKKILQQLSQLMRRQKSSQSQYSKVLKTKILQGLA